MALIQTIEPEKAEGQAKASNLKIYQYIKMCGVRINNYKRFTIFLGRIIIDILLLKKP